MWLPRSIVLSNNAYISYIFYITIRDYVKTLRTMHLKYEYILGYEQRFVPKKATKLRELSLDWSPYHCYSYALT